MRNESHDHSMPTEHNRSTVFRRLQYLVVAPHQILSTIHVASLENIEHAIMNFCQSTGEIQQRYMQRCYVTFDARSTAIGVLCVLPSGQYHYSLGGVPVNPCHEAHMLLAASISSPRLYRSLFPSTFNIRTLQLQLLIRCAIHYCLTIGRTPVVYSSDLRHG
jgi:hypothetical protein